VDKVQVFWYDRMNQNYMHEENKILLLVGVAACLIRRVLDEIIAFIDTLYIRNSRLQAIQRYL
jgi:hypothetical protein